MKENQLFFALLRAAMTDEGFETESIGALPTEAIATEAAWTALYRMATQQSLTGVVYTAVARLSREQQPPMALSMQWASEAETIRGLNGLLNSEAARLTRLFADKGRRTAILKGQANALLYPDTMSRQPGDIDIWVEGGRKSVIALLREMGLVSEQAKVSYHHVHLPPNEQGVTVEVHFRPSSGNHNPFTNKRLQRWLNAEILNTESVEEGFNVPSVRFALVMQLSHVQRHFFCSGIGLRQICDYYLLLRRSTADDRKAVADVLQRFGLQWSAEALMWVLGEVFQMDRALMLCDPDSYHGEWMLREIMDGGNFGYYAQRQHQGLWRRFFAGKMRNLRLMPFNFWGVFWGEMNFCKAVIQTLPERIRRRSFSLSEANKRDAMK